MVDTKYVISIPLDEDESEELGFPDLENMFRFMEILMGPVVLIQILKQET